MSGMWIYWSSRHSVAEGTMGDLAPDRAGRRCIKFFLQWCERFSISAFNERTDRCATGRMSLTPAGIYAECRLYRVWRCIGSIIIGMPDMQASTRIFLSTANKLQFFFASLLMQTTLVFFLIYGAVKGQWDWAGLLTTLGMTVLVFAFSGMFWVDTSELLVDDTGLSRKIAGRVLMQVPWTGIKTIREKCRNVPGARDDWPQIIIQVIPGFRRGVVLRLRRMLVITDKVEGFDELIEILNARIQQYSIQVEISSGGMLRAGRKLLGTPER